MAKGKLTEEQRAEIVQRYQAGENGKELARDYAVTSSSIYRVLRIAGAGARSPQEAWATKKGGAVPIGLMSRDRLRELYWGANSGYPSVAALARSLGCTHRALCQALGRLEISRRSLSEQRHIDIKAGRYDASRPGNRNGKRGCHGPTYVRTRKHRSIMSRVLSAVRQQQWPPVTRPCGWCGILVTRSHSYAKKHPFCACSRSHGSSYVNWHRWGNEAKPRPLILTRLRELLREHPYKALPFTRETLEKAAATIGATEAEILEVMLEGGGIR